MRNINNVEVAEVSGGLTAQDAASLLGAYVCQDVFRDNLNFPVAGVDVGDFVGVFLGVAFGAVAGRTFHHLVNDYVYPFTDSVTP